MLGPVPLGTAFFALCTLLAVVPIRRPTPLATVSWVLSAIVNELPFLFLLIVVASSPRDPVGLALSAMTVMGLAIVVRRGFASRAAVDEALGGDDRGRRRLPWARIVCLPWPVRPPAVERIRNIPYGDQGKDNRLDVYRHRSRPSPAPTLIHFHGGYFRRGRKSREARALLHHLARQGWTCISANYHLAATPAAGFPHHLVDAKRVVAWARTAGRHHGVDPDSIAVAGSSSGAHLAVMVALTANGALFQPGFEPADTSVAACIGLYGYYGQLGAEQPTSTPLAHPATHAPPILIAHGDHDTFTPVEGARRLVGHLRSTSTRPVTYLELPGGQHSFDLFHSIRFEAVIDGIERFAAQVGTGSADPPGR
jgi:acetyl esterase/lipase